MNTKGFGLERISPKKGESAKFWLFHGKIHRNNKNTPNLDFSFGKCENYC